jgi:hypothetical protein
MVEPGKTPGSYRIKTCGHVEGGQPAGWGLSAWNAPAIGAHRNGSSSKVRAHVLENKTQHVSLSCLQIDNYLVFMMVRIHQSLQKFIQGTCLFKGGGPRR